MKKMLIAILGVIDLVCMGSIFYLLFSNEALSAALAAIILPAVIGVVAAFLIGKLSSPVEIPASAQEQTRETLRRSA